MAVIKSPFKLYLKLFSLGGWTAHTFFYDIHFLYSCNHHITGPAVGKARPIEELTHILQLHITYLEVLSGTEIMNEYRKMVGPTVSSACSRSSTVILLSFQIRNL